MIYVVKGKKLGEAGQELDMFEQASDYVAGFLNGSELQAFERALSEDAELRAEVMRCRQHFDAIGVHVQARAPKLGPLALLRRELWGENWMPWRRRIRLWEFALGGIAAALLTFVVYNSALLSPAPSEILHAHLQSTETAMELEVAVDPAAQVVLVQWNPTMPPSGMRFELWVRTGERRLSLGTLTQLPVQRFELTAQQVEGLKIGSQVVLGLENENAEASFVGAILAQGFLKAFPLASR